MDNVFDMDPINKIIREQNKAFEEIRRADKRNRRLNLAARIAVSAAVGYAIAKHYGPKNQEK